MRRFAPLLVTLVALFLPGIAAADESAGTSAQAAAQLEREARAKLERVCASFDAALARSLDDRLELLSSAAFSRAFTPQRTVCTGGRILECTVRAVARGDFPAAPAR